MKKTTQLPHYIAITIAVLIVGYVLIANTTPINIKRLYSISRNGTPSLSPSNRVENTKHTSKQIDDLVYFYSKMTFKFDRAKVKVAFKNPYLDQPILLGYKDQHAWHYNTQVLDEPILNNLKWSKIGSGPYLYQKDPTYKKLDDFFKSPPQNKVVGIADYKNSEFLQPDIDLPEYKPSTSSTTINVPMRGKTIFYAYLEHEPFNMNITKQDINWHSDPDVMKITVYKGNESVYSATIDDDGNARGSREIGVPQQININNPGPGLPESGVYKIVVDAPTDCLITKIKTNLHKLVFEGPLYAADNHEVYGGAVERTQPTNLYTNAQKLNIHSDHGQSQSAIIGNQKINVTESNKIYSVDSNSPSTLISIPRSDMVINGSGYFAFSQDQFFVPSPYKLLPINSANDVTQADFVLTDYPGPPVHEAGWLKAERTFDISDADIQKGQLSWIINAPNLKTNSRDIEYKSLEMTMTKKGWLEQ
jgi:hypothetical protein